MFDRQMLFGAAAACLLLTGTGLASSAAEFNDVAVFATANQIRFEGRIQSLDDSTPVQLTCSIVQAKSGQSLWQGTLDAALTVRSHNAAFQFKIPDLKPEIWEPTAPVLYQVTISASQGGNPVGKYICRTGFRSFETRDGQLIFNGRPIFLRGIAINPPGRTVPKETGESPKFAHDYVSFLKSQNVNIIRMTHDSQPWFDACDELGMLIYQGQYGSPLGAAPNKQRPPESVARSVDAYKNLFTTYSTHPSIIIYVLSNELPTSGARGKAFHDFLSTAHSQLKAWDPTRLYIGNAGYGEGREGDICDVHRYWGWYYNSFLTYYNLREPHLFGDPDKNQAITFTECVGNFTGPSGEYNIIVRKQLGAQLNWTGHSPTQSHDAQAYQAFMVQQAAETFRRLRPINPRLSGLMPFTILFYNWSGITSFDQMKPKPAMDSLALAYQPVLLSLEFWTPNVFAGSKISGYAHVVNDSDRGSPLTKASLLLSLRGKENQEVLALKRDLADVPYYSTARIPVEFDLPPDLAAGKFALQGEVRSGTNVVSKNSLEFFIAPTNWPATLIRTNSAGAATTLALFDPGQQTKRALQILGMQAETITDLSSIPAECKALVLGERAIGRLDAQATNSLKQFVANGGRVLCLAQDPSRFSAAWLPEQVSFFTASPNDSAYPPVTRPFREHMNINLERPDHPVFAGLDRSDLRLWSDYTGWDQTKAGFPRVYPVGAGFKLAHPESLARTAILADYDRGLEGVALCEMFSGKGSVLLSGFDLVPRVGRDPLAERMLLNLLAYTASTGPRAIHPLVTEPIEWGNYASERGLICGPQNGLVINATWVKPATNPKAAPLTQSEGAWNTRPGDEFRPHGRSPFGPYGYSTSSSLREIGGDPYRGKGFFWAAIPAGRTNMITTVESDGEGEQELKVQINEQVIILRFKAQGAKTLDLPAALPRGATNILVQFEGPKTLVLRRTVFE
jgi:hypothetical protein